MGRLPNGAAFKSVEDGREMKKEKVLGTDALR